MPTYFQRPENALKRANEFIDVGKAQRALDALYDVIKSKKHRTWQKIHEPIMEKYLELCVDLRKSHIAKEGLYQYKNICQQVNINSLVDVVRKYIALAEERTEAARQESHQTVLDIDDLDLPDSPESLLLKAVSGEDTQDRTDRAILTPWVKFLWESYRQCLDLLRNNSRVERLYQDIAQQAFKFCLKYSRKTEFRKLCDNLRTHLGHVHKHQHQQTAINLNNADSQAMHLETRLVQLDSAINMELWQEAFKAVEDIHGLITLSKKQPKPSLMANYYQKLGLVFAKSGNHLFHASTLHRLFNLSREQRKNLSQDELQRMANRVVCATLAIPIPASRNAVDNLLVMDESGMEKQRRLATLLMLPSPPTRQSLVKDLVKYGSLQYVTTELQNLYKYLEIEFHPLQLYPAVQPIVQFIGSNEDLAIYVPHLEEIIITRVLKQVSQVYQAIEFKRFASLVPFADKFRLERIIVGAAKNMELQVRIDHRLTALTFGTDLGLSQKEEAAEGPTIQNMPSEQIRNQLTVMGRVLSQSVSMISPKQTEEDEELKANILNSYRLTAKKEHGRILQRRQVIEERKEQLENLNDLREREEQEHAEEARRRAYEAEMARLEREAEERKKQRQQQEHQEIKRKHVRERLEELRKTPQGSKIFQNIDEEEMADLDVDEIMAKQVEQLEKEKKELQERLKGQEKKVDYLARAKRIEELPLLLKQYEEEKQVSEEFWEQEEKEKIEQMKSERMHALEIKTRLSKILEDSEMFLNSLKKSRKSEYEEKLKDFEKQIAIERKKRLQDRKEKRREERRTKWRLEKEEAAQRARDEQLKKDREEKERLAQEERDREEREYAERLAKLEAQAERQRQRDREIEERLKTDENLPKDLEDKPKETLIRAQPTEKEGSWRRGGDKEGRGDAEGEGGESRPWRPSQRWKTDNDDAKDRPPPPREENDWRKPPRDDRGPGREDRGAWREDRTPAARDDRRDRGPDNWRDKGTPKDDRGSAWDDRRVRDERGPPRDDRRSGESWREKGPSRESGDSWRRGFPRDDRGTPRQDEDRAPLRHDDRGFTKRDEDRGFTKRDEDRSFTKRDEDRGFMRRDDDRGPVKRDDDRGPLRRDGDRGPVRRDEEGGPLRRDEGKGPLRRDDDRNYKRDDRRGGDSWRDRPQKEDDWRGPPRDDRPKDRVDRPRDRDERPIARDERPIARDDHPRERDDRLKDRDDRPRDDRRDRWREKQGEERSWRDAPRATPKDDIPRSSIKDDDRPPARGPPRERPQRDEPRGPQRPEKRSKPEQTEDDDGWTTVRY